MIRKFDVKLSLFVRYRPARKTIIVVTLVQNTNDENISKPSMYIASETAHMSIDKENQRTITNSCGK